MIRTTTTATAAATAATTAPKFAPPAPAHIQTKLWRQEQPWYKGGRKNECEIYQVQMLEEILGNKNADALQKTNDRICKINNTIAPNIRPMTELDGFEWTENFDRKLTTPSGAIWYFNLKFVCEPGGAQTRTLREVYDFIKNQILYTRAAAARGATDAPVNFVNILDGDNCHKHMSKFQYLLQNHETPQKIFIGSMYEFQNWPRRAAI